MEQSEKTLDMIVNLCKNRGYVSAFMDGRNLEFSLFFIRTVIDLIMQRKMFITHLCPLTPP